MFNFDSIFRSPGFPSPSRRIAGLEHEAAVLCESGTYGGQRRKQLFVFHEHLECMSGHDDRGRTLGANRLRRGRRGPNLYRAASVPAPASPRRDRARTAVRFDRLPVPTATVHPSRSRHRAHSSPTSPEEGRSQSPPFPRRMRHIARTALARKTGDRPRQESSRNVTEPEVPPTVLADTYRKTMARTSFEKRFLLSCSQASEYPTVRRTSRRTLAGNQRPCQARTPELRRRAGRAGRPPRTCSSPGSRCP